MADGPEDLGPPGPGPEAQDAEGSKGIRARYASARERGDAWVGRAQERFDEERRRRSWLEIVWQALVRMQRRGGPLLSGGLAYRIFLWELPMALALVSILGLFVDIGSVTPEQAAHDLGMSAALTAAVAQAVAQTDSSAWWLLLLGLWLTLWTARSAVSALRLIHRIAWNQDALPKINAFTAPVFFSVYMLVAMCAALVSGNVVAGGVVVSILGWIVVIAINFALVAFGMTLLPRAGRPWPVVLPGAVLFTVVVRGMTIASQVYFAGKLDRVDDLYGSLGIAIVMLLWLYLFAWGWVAATFINAGLAGIREDRPVLPAQAQSGEPG
jgi:uncharacterized BrkB/YihY/UPF0761 family membrane protein